MYRAVGYYAWKYGHIDWIESNNEFWLEVDARLRTDFHVTTGVNLDGIEAFKEKSEMKKYYAKGGIRTARQLKASEGLEAARRFAIDAGIHAEIVIMRVGCGAVVKGYHIGPYLEHGNIVGIVNHVRRIATTRSHVHLQCNEVANLTQTSVRFVKSEKFQVNET